MKYSLLFFLSLFLAFTSCSTKQGNNQILNQMIEGKTHFDDKEYLLAKNIFLEISHKLNQVWDKPEESKKVRALWYEEMIKTFKGEPYERVMLFFYLGVIFLLEKDYGNAQASFGQAILQDSFAQEEQHRADFALAYFLQSLSQNHLGSEQLAQQNLKNFQELKADLLEADFTFGNTTLLMETGKAPQKITAGKHKEYLKYQRAKDEIHTVKLTVDNEQEIIFPLGDIYWQASSRGGRPIDVIAKNKVIFKDTSKGVADVSLRIGLDIASFGNSDQATTAALAFAAIGIGAAILSGSVKTKADTRQWSNLPNKIYLKNLQLETGSHFVKIEFLDAKGNFLGEIAETIETKEQTSNTFYWRL